jgi:hypothetical protein
VDGDVIRAPKAGSIYLIKCFRWATIEKVDGLVGGRPPAGEEVCQHCQANFETQTLAQPDAESDPWS